MAEPIAPLREKLTAIIEAFDVYAIKVAYPSEEAWSDARRAAIDEASRAFAAAQPIGRNPNDELVAIMREREEREVRPWGATMRRFNDAKAMFQRNTLEERRAQFLDAARNQSLPMWKVMMGTYDLYSTAEQAQLFASFYLHARSVQELVTWHNISVIERMADSQNLLSLHHRTIFQMDVPCCRPSQSSAP